MIVASEPLMPLNIAVARAEVSKTEVAVVPTHARRNRSKVEISNAPAAPEVKQAEGSNKSKIVISDPSSGNEITRESLLSAASRSVEENESKKAELRKKGVYVVSQQLGESLASDKGTYVLGSHTGSFYWSIAEPFEGQGFSLCVQGHNSYFLDEKEFSEYPLEIQKDGSFHFAFVNEKNGEVVNFTIKNSNNHACDITEFKGFDQKNLVDKKSESRARTLEMRQRKTEEDDATEEILYKPAGKPVNPTDKINSTTVTNEDLRDEGMCVLPQETGRALKTEMAKEKGKKLTWDVDASGTLQIKCKNTFSISRDQYAEYPIMLESNGGITIGFIDQKNGDLFECGAVFDFSSQYDLGDLGVFEQKSVDRFKKFLAEQKVAELIAEENLIIQRSDYGSPLRWRIFIKENDIRFIQILDTDSKVVFEISVEANEKYKILSPAKGGFLKARLSAGENNKSVAYLVCRSKKDREDLLLGDFSDDFIKSFKLTEEDEGIIPNKIYNVDNVYQAPDGITVYETEGIRELLTQAVAWKLDPENKGYLLVLNSKKETIGRCFIQNSFIKLSEEKRIAIRVLGIEGVRCLNRARGDTLDMAEYGFHPDYVEDAAPKPVVPESVWKSSWRKQAEAEVVIVETPKIAPLKQELEAVSSDSESSAYAVNDDIYEALNQGCSWRVHKKKPETIQFLDEDEDGVGVVKMQKLSSKPIILLQKGALPVICATTPGSPEILVSRYSGDKTDLSKNERFDAESVKLVKFLIEQSQQLEANGSSEFNAEYRKKLENARFWVVNPYNQKRLQLLDEEGDVVYAEGILKLDSEARRVIAKGNLRFCCLNDDETDYIEFEVPRHTADQIELSEELFDIRDQ